MFDLGSDNENESMSQEDQLELEDGLDDLLEED